MTVLSLLLAAHALSPRGRAPRRARPLRAVAEQNTKANADAKITTTYVAELFDGFAESFDGRLLDELDYCAPKVLAEAAARRAAERGTRYATCLDAGCGTGLAGHGLRASVDALVGVDLSPNMLLKASELCYEAEGAEPTRADEAARRATGWPPVYDDMFVGNLLDLDALPRLAPTYDLIASADVLCYFGALEDVLGSLAARLAPGGDLIFSVETLREGEYSWVLQAQDRYAHSPAYVADVAGRVGLEVVSATAFQPRTESGYPVAGTLHCLTKPR